MRKLFGGLGNSMFQYAYLYNQMKKGEVPDFYLQDEKYFKESSEEIKKMFGQGIVPVDRISLHIRRGDYLNNPFYVDLTETDYYDRALRMFPNEKFLVFCRDRQPGSDDKADKNWCIKFLSEKIGKDRFEIWNGKTEIDDMNAMAGCKGHIMANSSFSWWAAFLGGGKVIAPLKWFSDGVERIKLLDAWTKI